MKRTFAILLLLVAQAIPATVQSREKNLDEWFDHELIPYVQQQLTTHPRFRNETVMFVALQENAPTAGSNALALSLRDRILAAAIDTSDVSIGWQQGHGSSIVEAGVQKCVEDDVRYYVGIELSQVLDGSYTVTVRALDLNDRVWVAGFGQQWQGQLNTPQRQLLRQQRIDSTFLGTRGVPFSLTHTDLLAAQLAYQLACSMQQQPEHDYVVLSDASAEHAGLGGTLALISNNLATQQALRPAANPAAANAVLSGEAHHISGDLYQYWLTLTPQADSEYPLQLSASAYIVIPDTATKPTVAKVATGGRHQLPSRISIPNAGGDGLIGELRIDVSPVDPKCEFPCSVLEVNANDDAIVFILEHQAQNGLVRLSGGRCTQRTVASIVRDDEALKFPISKVTSGNWTTTLDWQLAPSANTFYAIAVSDADVARKMANLIDALPLKCARLPRPGKRGDELREWLVEFATLAAQSAKHFDWRAIHEFNTT